MDRLEALQKVHDAVIQLSESPLYAYRVENGYLPVFGQGDIHADVMFIGEAPGEKEAKTGQPFCGASGKMLDQLLASIALKRETVYVTNIVKDRPPKNRDPKPDEIALYAPFLTQQINIIQPKVIATLGRFSMAFVLALFNAPEATHKISDLHGKPIPVNTPYGQAQVLPLYHPAVALYNGGQKTTLMADFQILETLIKG